ncbi:unnamed protein product [Rotaria sordida]|uniref:Uncharacterized protein n=1 Tax=Rotaria sordida TaxID=392033 RepID=A0A814G8C2_9BILA|nr:unnamed protein product [Rotaria sordida]
MLNNHPTPTLSWYSIHYLNVDKENKNVAIQLQLNLRINLFDTVKACRLERYSNIDNNVFDNVQDNIIFDLFYN